MRLKMHKGTTSTSQPTLCGTCRMSQRVRMQQSNEEVYVCHNVHPAQPFRGNVAECSSYDDRRLPTLRAMQEIAWRVSSDKNRPIGFLSPSEYRARVKKEEEDIGPLLTPGGDVFY